MRKRVVCLYVPEDVVYARALDRHLTGLRRSLDLDIWSLDQLPPGEDIEANLTAALSAADVILCLLSSDFLASSKGEAWTELARRQQRRSGVVLIPILLRPADYGATYWGAMEPLPKGGKPVSMWSNQDAAWLEVVQGLRRVLTFAPPKDQPSGRRADGGPRLGPPAAIHPLDRIFSVKGLPQLSYVEPDQMGELRHHLQHGRDSLVLEGPSGIGKTTALNKALGELGLKPVAWILGTDPVRSPQQALQEVLDAGYLTSGGILVVDDFQLLDPDTQQRLAKLMKYLVDRGEGRARVILVGVNLVGDTLLRDVPDLTGRYTTLCVRRQTDATIARMIQAGERAANIEFARRDRFVELACGSFFIAQMLCYQAGKDEQLIETARSFRVIDTNPEGPTLDKVVQDLSGRFHELLVTFATCDEQAPPRGAGIALLWLLSRAPDSCVTLETARAAYGHHAPVGAALSWMAQSHLSRRFEDFPRLRSVLHYHRDRQALAAEDPRLTFYLRSLPWEAFLRQTRHRPDHVRWDPVDGPLFAPFALGPGPEPEEDRRARPEPGSADGFPASVLLHLSDLHFQDRRQASLWFDQLAEDLRGELKVEPRQLDLVLLTGDITDKGQADGYKAAQQFLADLQGEFQLAPEQMLIVPGNHDLNRAAARSPEDGRFLDFAEFYRSVRPDAYPQLEDHQFTLHHFPEKQILVLGLNSAWEIDAERPGQASINGVALGRALRQIRNTRRYDGCLKLAIWHHPIQSESDDRIRDTGFLEVLAKAGFRLGLHGHVHEAQLGLFRYDLTLAGRQLSLLGAGTFGAVGPARPAGIPLQYQLLRLRGRDLRVETRRRDKPNGAWRPDARWDQGPGQSPLPYYDVAL